MILYPSKKPCVMIFFAKCVTSSYHYKFTLFHIQMNVIQTVLTNIYKQRICYKAENARTIDAQLNFQYTGCLKCHLG